MLSEKEIEARQKFFAETGRTPEESDVSSATMLARLIAGCLVVACLGVVYWLS